MLIHCSREAQDLNRGRTFIRQFCDATGILLEPSVEEGINTVVKVRGREREGEGEGEREREVL